MQFGAIQSLGYITIGPAGTVPGPADAVNVALDIQTTRAIRLPRLTAAQRMALTPSEAMYVYDIDNKTPYFYDGAAWKVSGSGSSHPPVTVHLVPSTNQIVFNLSLASGAYTLSTVFINHIEQTRTFTYDAATSTLAYDATVTGYTLSGIDDLDIHLIGS